MSQPVEVLCLSFNEFQKIKNCYGCNFFIKIDLKQRNQTLSSSQIYWSYTTLVVFFRCVEPASGYEENQWLESIHSTTQLLYLMTNTSLYLNLCDCFLSGFIERMADFSALSLPFGHLCYWAGWLMNFVCFLFPSLEVIWNLL